MDNELKVKPKARIIKERTPYLVAGEVGAILELTVRDKTGRITDHREMKSKSFVRQFLELLYIQMYQISEVTRYNVRDITNTLQAWNNIKTIFDVTAAANVVSQGIIVGTGTTPPTIDDYVIETIIAHGVGAGQLQYGVVSFGAPTSDATTSQFEITRNFANASGGDVTVNELAVYVEGDSYYEGLHSFMIIRDVIAGGIVVPTGQTLTVNYREQAVI